MSIPRDFFFSGLTPVDSTLITFTDGNSFIPTATQTAIDIEKADDGTIKTSYLQRSR